MANIQIQHDDLIETLTAQRNEAWGAAAMAGAAVRSAGKRIDELEQDLAQANAIIQKLRPSDVAVLNVPNAAEGSTNGQISSH